MQIFNPVLHIEFASELFCEEWKKVESMFELRDEANVRKFLQDKRFLFEAVQKVGHDLLRFFPGCRLALEVLGLDDIGPEKLGITVITRLSPEELVNKMDAFIGEKIINLDWIIQSQIVILDEFE